MVRARIIFALQNSLTTLFQFPRQVAMKGNNNPLDSTSQNNPSAVDFSFNCRSHRAQDLPNAKDRAGMKRLRRKG
jgi:hypothetical protein